MAARTFRDLLVWQEAYKLTIAVYKIANSFPPHEQFGLTSQLKRAIVSVTSNIAEGFGRVGSKEKDQFYSIAGGSLSETESQLLVAVGIGYITKEKFARIEPQIVLVQKLLHGLRKVNKQKGAKK